MVPRALVVALLVALALPVAPAEPQDDSATLVCIYVDPGPPPFFVLQDCDRALLGAVVNRTGGAVWVKGSPCAEVRVEPPNVTACGTSLP